MSKHHWWYWTQLNSVQNLGPFCSFVLVVPHTVCLSLSSGGSDECILFLTALHQTTDRHSYRRVAEETGTFSSQWVRYFSQDRASVDIWTLIFFFYIVRILAISLHIEMTISLSCGSPGSLMVVCHLICSLMCSCLMP